jgi:hypothetical protein
MIAKMETALAGLRMGRLAVLGMQTKLVEGNAIQANGLILIEALALLSYATTEAHGKIFEPHRKLRTIIRNNYSEPAAAENERY